MATLNLSINGHEIRSSYNAIVNAPAASDQARWALYQVQAPLMNAFQNSAAKESILKVEDSRSGELDDLLEDFNEGRVQFAFVRLADPNTRLPKNVLIAWCGGGVPERTKGYFTSHLAAVSKVLHGYHVQITARSTDDLSPELILKKVADASGAQYSGDGSVPSGGGRPPPPAKKPVFTPTSSSAAHNPLIAARNRRQDNVDEDGWGADAPPVTRTQLEKVEPAYKPVKVNLAELTKQTPAGLAGGSISSSRSNDNPDVIGGTYKPVGKVDIAAIRAAAKEKQDDRPTIVKGAYEPVGKVDIAAIRAKARVQRDDDEPVASERAVPSEPAEPPKSLAQRSAAFGQPERLTSLPKPKVANKFGGASSFTGTKAPAPGGLGFGGAPPPKPPVIGAASRTFADQGGKTPAQLWAEKKGKQGSGSVGVTSPGLAASGTTPLSSQRSGGEWKSGYTGKSWATVQTPAYGHGAAVTEQHTGEGSQPDASAASPEPPVSPGGGVSALRDRFRGAQPMGQAAPSAPAIPHVHTGESRGIEDDDAPPPPIPTASRPSGAFQLPGMPTRPAQQEEPVREREESPVRIAVPVARAPSPEPEPEPEPVPVRAPAAVARPVPVPAQEEEEEPPAPAAAGGGGGAGLRALIQYDYEKAEDNEIELVEGDYVTNIDQVDEDWWMGTNSRGETGLFPSNYVELVADDNDGKPDDQGAAAQSHPPPPADEPRQEHAEKSEAGPSAIAQYDYEAGEDNELSFPEGARITKIEFPDDDWWLGTYQGHTGLFPSNYVELEK